MIQIGTILNVIDNSGAKKALCIKIANAGYRQRYASTGDTILVSIKETKPTQQANRVKKGDLHSAIIIRTKSKTYLKQYGYRQYLDNSIVLLNKNKLLGTRIFCHIANDFKYSKYLKLITLTGGLSI